MLVFNLIMCIIFVHSYIVAICFCMLYAEVHMLDKYIFNMLSSQNKDIIIIINYYNYYYKAETIQKCS